MAVRCADVLASSCSVLAMAAATLLAAPGAGAESLHQALTQTYRTNPQLDAARATLRATDEDVARANAGYRPTVSGNANVAWSRSRQ